MCVGSHLAVYRKSCHQFLPRTLVLAVQHLRVRDCWNLVCERLPKIRSIASWAGLVQPLKDLGPTKSSTHHDIHTLIVYQFRDEVHHCIPLLELHNRHYRRYRH